MICRRLDLFPLAPPKPLRRPPPVQKLDPLQVMASARVRSPPATAQALDIARFGINNIFANNCVWHWASILRRYLTWLEALSLSANRVPQEETMVYHLSFGAPPMFGSHRPNPPNAGLSFDFARAALELVR